MQKIETRRKFLKAGFLSSALFLMSGCELFGVTTVRATIELVQVDLFPKAKELKINTSNYITTVLRHSRISQADKLFLKNGAKWLNEKAISLYGMSYVKLPALKRQEVLKEISKSRWGESWIHSMMTYIFEAMLGDPIYGGNNGEAAWKWLEFDGGRPRPVKAYL